MGKISCDHDSSNLQFIIISILLIALLCSSSISIPLSESFVEAEAKPAGANSLKNKIVDELGTNMQDMTKKLRDVKGQKVPNQYIVVLKDNNLLSPGKVKSLAGEATNLGAALRHIYDHALSGFAIKVPNEKALEAILKIPEVDYVEPDIKVRAFLQSLPTGIDRVDADLSSTKSGDGSGAVNADIGILDTGIDLSHSDHLLILNGKQLFEKNCSSCHGRYGEKEYYPGKLVPGTLVGTDSLLWKYYILFPEYAEWFNKSWFATSEHPAFIKPQAGYMAPPLDGIWLTAPYFHNGSVPTLEAVLNSSLRPRYWKRNFNDPCYDYKKAGWHYKELNSPGNRQTYNTDMPGYGNYGHYFSDGLTHEERKALLEYLKTL